MFCPKCANQSADDLKFCTVCGTNLASVTMAMQDPKSLVSEREWKQSHRLGNALISAKLSAMANRKPDSPAERSIKLMQAGVIVGSVGIGITIFLFFLFTALASTEVGDPQGQAALLALRAVGLVPFFVGVWPVSQWTNVSIKCYRCQSANAIAETTAAFNTGTIVRAEERNVYTQRNRTYDTSFV